MDEATAGTCILAEDHGPVRVLTLAAVEGYAFGAGAALALACDRVVTAADAVFGLPSPASAWPARWASSPR
jgi:enoyl-CoA hydratase/carnithine racemase